MKTHSIKFNFIMNAILTVSTVIFPMVTFPYYSRVLGAEGTGSVGFAVAVIAYFTMIASLGVPTYGIRACAKVRDDKEKLSQTVHELLFINGISTVVVYIVFFISLRIVPKFVEQKEILQIVCVAIVLNTMGVQWLYSALEKYSYITICTIVFKILGIILMFAFVHSPKDYIIYGGINVIASYGSGILNFINMRRYIFFNKMERYDLKRHIKPILTFFFMAASISIYTNLDKVMLGFMKSNIEVGYYDASVKIKTILVNVVTSLGTVLLPRMSFYIEKGEKEAFYRTLKKAFRFVLVMSVGLMVFFIIFAKESILLLSGEEFIPSVFPMQLLMPTLLFIGLSNITGIQILTPMGDEKKVLYSILVGASLDFILNLILIPRYGATGAAFATVVAELMVLIVQCIYLKQMIKGILENINLGKIIMAVVFAGIGAQILQWRMPFQTTSIAISVVFLGIYAVSFFGIYVGLLVLMKEPMVMEIAETGLNVIRKKKKGKKDMYETEKNSWLKHGDFILLDLFYFQMAYIIAFMIRHGAVLPYRWIEYRNMAVIIGLTELCLSFFIESYKNILYRGCFEELKKTVLQISIVEVILVTYLFFTKSSEIYSRIVFIQMWILAILFTYAGRCLQKKYVRKQVLDRKKLQKLIVVSTRNNVEAIIRKLEEKEYKNFYISGIILIDGNKETTILGIPVLTCKNKIEDIIKEEIVDQIFIDGSRKDIFVQETLQVCREMGIVIHYNLGVNFDVSNNSIVEMFGGYMVVTSSVKFVDPRQMLVKRIMDIIGGLVGSFLTIILTLVLAPIIYIQSPGPIFFSQKRVGRNGRIFNIYKFRSMYPDAEKRKKELMQNNKMSGFMFKMDDDPRIIPIGKFIRKTSLDEFPQFFNILRGDMSLVGTRPPTVDEYEKYEKHHRVRLAIKPGLTGMWQVNGRSNVVDFEEVVALDKKYIEGWNIGMDLKILFQTVKVIVLGKGAI